MHDDNKVENTSIEERSLQTPTWTEASAVGAIGITADPERMRPRQA